MSRDPPRVVGCASGQVAKMLSFAQGTSQVAWNQFSQLWMISAGFTPTQAGTLKTVSMLAKSLAQPGWAAAVDLRFLGRLHPSLERASPHAAVILSTGFSLVIMEVLRRFGPQWDFWSVLALRMVGSALSGGTNLIDAMVAQLSYGSKEGYGRQRMWSSVATGSMSLWVGGLIDRYGLGFVFAYTYAARALLVTCVIYALTIAVSEDVRVHGGGGGVGGAELGHVGLAKPRSPAKAAHPAGPNPAAPGPVPGAGAGAAGSGRLTSRQYLLRLAHMLRSRPTISQVPSLSRLTYFTLPLSFSLSYSLSPLSHSLSPLSHSLSPSLPLSLISLQKDTVSEGVPSYTSGSALRVTPHEAKVEV